MVERSLLFLTTSESAVVSAVLFVSSESTSTALTDEIEKIKHTIKQSIIISFIFIIHPPPIITLDFIFYKVLESLQ